MSQVLASLRRWRHLPGMEQQYPPMCCQPVVPPCAKPISIADRKEYGTINIVRLSNCSNAHTVLTVHTCWARSSGDFGRLKWKTRRTFFLSRPMPKAIVPTTTGDAPSEAFMNHSCVSYQRARADFRETFFSVEAGRTRLDADDGLFKVQRESELE